MKTGEHCNAEGNVTVVSPIRKKQGLDAAFGLIAHIRIDVNAPDVNAPDVNAPIESVAGRLSFAAGEPRYCPQCPGSDRWWQLQHFDHSIAVTNRAGQWPIDPDQIRVTGLDDAQEPNPAPGTSTNTNIDDTNSPLFNLRGNGAELDIDIVGAALRMGADIEIFAGNNSNGTGDIIWDADLNQQDFCGNSPSGRLASRTYNDINMRGSIDDTFTGFTDDRLAFPVLEADQDG